MERLGVLADVHGNAAALRAALWLLDGMTLDRVVCLGDVVGYNPGGDECVALLEERGIETIAGNHDLIAIGRLDTSACWYKAAHALERTRRDLTSRSRRFLASLPPSRSYEGGVLLVHGGVDDPERYLLTDGDVAREAARVARAFPAAEVCFYGHTHEPRVHRVRRAPGAPAERLAPSAPGVPVALEPREGHLFMVNPGSIDGSRKERPGLAELAVLELGARRLTHHSVRYDHDAVERAARARGYRVSRAAELSHRAGEALVRARGTAIRSARRALAQLGRLAPQSR